MADFAEESPNSFLHCLSRIDSLSIGTGLLWVESIALLSEDVIVNVHFSLRCEFTTESEQGHPRILSLCGVADAITNVYDIHFEEFIVRNVLVEQMEDLLDRQDCLAFDLVFIEITILLK